MVADISNKLHLTSGATTSLLNQLEEESLIQRVRDEKDRRVVWVSLTDESKKLVSMITEKRNGFLKDMLAALTVEEQEEYFRLLNKIDALLSDKYGFSY
jgi:DNA-binding MarR family transcriptional regulator